MSETGAITLEEFRQRVDKTRTKCEECGWRGHSLVAHLKDVHSTSPGQYKKNHPSSSLISPILSELLRSIPRKSKQHTELGDFLEVFEYVPRSGRIDNTEEVKKLLPPQDESLKDLIPTEIEHFYYNTEATEAIIYGMVTGKNVYLEGPTGSGKTELVMQIHSILGRAVKRVNMNGDITTANFIGQRQIDPAKGTYFDYGNLPKAMRNGHTLLVDEIDYMPPTIAAVLNSVLENKRTLYLPETDEFVEAEKGFTVIATANTGGKGDLTGIYSGTEVLNTAFLDRFSVKLATGYLSEDQESKMLAERFPQKDLRKISSLVKAAAEIRTAFLSGVLPFTISTRKMIDILEMEDALGFSPALRCTVLNWADEDNKEVVTQIFDRCGLEIAK